MARRGDDSVEPKDTSEAEVSPGTYQVGNCRPPLETRFKKGQSGNPGGRPKGAKNTRTLVREELEKKIPVRLPDGSTRKMTKRRVMVTKVVNRAVETGDSKAVEAIIKMEGPVENVNPIGEQPPEDFTSTDRALLTWYLEMANEGEL